MGSSDEAPPAGQDVRSILPLGVDQLLGGAVEGARLELKASWDEDKAGPQVLKTLCAFANDLQNLNGGYVVIGVAEQEGVAVRPVKGLPFDDRRAFEASNEDLRISLAREFLHDVGSDLVREQDAERVYAAMQMTRRQNGHTVPRNVGLLFFSDDPQQWFRGARIEAAEFSDDAGATPMKVYAEALAAIKADQS